MKTTSLILLSASLAIAASASTGFQEFKMNKNPNRPKMKMNGRKLSKFQLQNICQPVNLLNPTFLQ